MDKMTGKINNIQSTKNRSILSKEMAITSSQRTNNRQKQRQLQFRKEQNHKIYNRKTSQYQLIKIMRKITIYNKLLVYSTKRHIKQKEEKKPDK